MPSPQPSLCILSPGSAYDDLAAEEIAAARALFPHAEFRPWTDPGDLSGFDLVSPLLAWGYHLDPALWYRLLGEWDAAAIRFVNPLPLLRWNTDKSYLVDLANKDIPTVPTRPTVALTSRDLEAARAAFGIETLIVKPAISGGAHLTHRLRPDDALPAEVAGLPMLIQPMLSRIGEGEISLFHFGGAFSHAVIKVPVPNDFRVQPQFGGVVSAIVPDAEALNIATAAIAAAPLPPVYARTDLVRGDDGRWLLIELELIEPSLFLDHADGSGTCFAAALMAG